MRERTLHLILAVVVLLAGFAAAVGVTSAAAGKQSITPQLKPEVHGRWGIFTDGSGVFVIAMRVTGAAAGASVSIACTHLCSTAERQTADAAGRVVSAKFKGKKLRRGTVVAVRATKPGFNGTLLRLRIIGNPKTKALYAESRYCIPEGTSTPKARCSGHGSPPGTTTVALTTTDQTGPSTPDPPAAELAAPTGVAADVTAQNEVALSWNAVANADGYVVFLDGQQLTKLGKVTSYKTSPLECGKTYALDVEATSTNRASAKTTTNATTSACPGGPEPTSLPPPSGTNATVTPDNHLVLSWNTVAGALDYNIYLDGNRIAAVSGTPTYDYGVVACGKTFSPGVQSRGQPGQVSTIATVTVNSPPCPNAPPDTTPPSAPTNLTELFPSDTGFTLSWTASSDDVGVTGYDLYLAGAKVATVPAGYAIPSLGGLGYVFGGLSCGTSYQVAITAFDAAGNRSARGVKTTATAPCPSAVPAPTGVVAHIDSDGNYGISWNAVDGASGYYLWLNGSRLLEVGGTSFGYGKLTCGQTATLGVQTHMGDQVSVVVSAQVTANPC